MQSGIIEPKPVHMIYVTGGNSISVSQVIKFLDDLRLKVMIAKRNQAGSDSDWRKLGELYNKNLQAVLKSDLCLALLEGNLTDIADVCVEMGLAYANDIPVLALCTSKELRSSPMVLGMCAGDDQMANSVEELQDLINEHIELTNAALGIDNE